MVERASGVRAALRELPSVERLASALDGGSHALAVAAAQEEIDAARARILDGDLLDLEEADLLAGAERRRRDMQRPSLRRVINATGVVLHTNLGRAPLAEEAADAAARAGRFYTNLELDLESGERGSRGDHVEPLICELTSAEAALAVNNNAAAVLLAVAALAAGRELIVSRGELVEIGGSFRIPEIVAQSGARLVEVGTTNRTRIDDYREAIGPETGAVLRVHQSNFRTVGFTESVSIAELCGLAQTGGIPLIEDLGSGAAEPVGDEPVIGRSVEAGADVVCFSGDKLLGGPQAGILAGSGEAIDACRSHPLARALRLDSLQLAALEATLRLHREGAEARIPALAMLHSDSGKMRARAERLVELIGGGAELRTDSSRPGGGSLPLAELEGPVCALRPPAGADALAAALRAGHPPLIARISEGLVLLDPRTIAAAEIEDTARVAREALAR